MQYKDLNLKKVRDNNGLDFAHFTYKKGQCSCCYGPKDMAKRYWKDHIIPEGNDYTYILFKNAYNGSGRVKRTDTIKELTHVSWRFPIEKLQSVCRDLQEQVSPEYTVFVPSSAAFTITIVKNDSKYWYESYSKDTKNYTRLDLL